MSGARAPRGARSFLGPGARRLKTLDLAFDCRAIGYACGPRTCRQARHERLESLEALDVEAIELGERIGMIVDPEIERRVCFGRTDQQRDRLLAALVAACRLASLHRCAEPLGEGQPPTC